MSRSLATQPPFRLGIVEVRPAERLVVCGQKRVILEPRAMQVLVVLANASGRVVSRDTLVRTCWSGRAVSEDALYRIISKLRRLPEAFDAEAFTLQTFSKVGYKLCPAGVSPTSSPVPHGEKAHGVTVIVVPFHDLRGASQTAAVATGITEDIVVDLNKRNWITSVLVGQDRVDILRHTEAGKHSVVLKGTVRLWGKQLRVTAHLTDVESTKTIWAERFDRKFEGTFLPQDDICQAILGALDRFKPAQAGKLMPSAAIEAYQIGYRLYSLGYIGGLQHYRKIVHFCERAIATEPDYAEPWALLAIAQNHLRKHYAEGDGGKTAIGRALALNPYLAQTHTANALLSLTSGQYMEAESSIDAAQQIDPSSAEAQIASGQLHYRLQRMDEAITAWERAAMLADMDYTPLGYLLTAYQLGGVHISAKRTAHMLVQRSESVLARDPSNGVILGFSAVALATLGDAEGADAAALRARALDPFNMQIMTSLARANILLGRHERALDQLETAISSKPSGYRTFSASDPSYNAIRDYPRFKAMLGQ